MSTRYVLKGWTHYRRDFDGSGALFLACWKQYRVWLNGAIDDPESDSDVMGWLNRIAAERVNNPRSRFFIYG